MSRRLLIKRQSLLRVGRRDAHAFLIHAGKMRLGRDIAECRRLGIERGRRGLVDRRPLSPEQTLGVEEHALGETGVGRPFEPRGRPGQIRRAAVAVGEHETHFSHGLRVALLGRFFEHGQALRRIGPAQEKAEEFLRGGEVRLGHGADGRDGPRVTDQALLVLEQACNRIARAGPQTGLLGIGGHHAPVNFQRAEKILTVFERLGLGQRVRRVDHGRRGCRRRRGDRRVCGHRGRR